MTSKRASAMNTLVWILYVVLSNANGDVTGIVEMEGVFESKQACKEKAVTMRLYSENYGCRPVFEEENQ